MHPLSSIPIHACVYIYGTGTAGQAMLAWLTVCRPDIQIIGFLDSRHGGRLRGYRIWPVDRTGTLAEREFDLIVIASTFRAQIVDHLNKLGIDRHIAPSIPTYLLKETLPYTPLEHGLRRVIRASSRLIPRNTQLFFGEHGGKFIGNNKYYFLHLLQQNRYRLFWMTDNATIHRELVEAGIPALDFHSSAGIIALFRASHFYFDNTTWQRAYPWLRYFRCKIIHMSHGVGLKITEKMQIPAEFMDQLSPEQERRLNDRIFHNDLLISTSDFYAEKVSAPAYNTPIDRITRSGYPKNDLFYHEVSGSQVFSDLATLALVDKHRATGGQIVVYAPTFRDMEGAFRFAATLSYPKLAQFLNRHDILLIIKGHSKALTEDAELDARHHNIHIYDNNRDGYPLLTRADMLITDYSSIYMDYLHTRRPMLFFPFDYDDYTRKHRNLQFDYHEMTPGPKAYSLEELIQWIEHFLVKGEDGYGGDRQRVFQLAFAHADGHSSERVQYAIEHMR